MIITSTEILENFQTKRKSNHLIGEKQPADLFTKATFLSAKLLSVLSRENGI